MIAPRQLLNYAAPLRLPDVRQPRLLAYSLRLWRPARRPLHPPCRGPLWRLPLYRARRLSFLLYRAHRLLLPSRRAPSWLSWLYLPRAFQKRSFHQDALRWPPSCSFVAPEPPLSARQLPVLERQPV